MKLPRILTWIEFQKTNPPPLETIRKGTHVLAAMLMAIGIDAMSSTPFGASVPALPDLDVAPRLAGLVLFSTGFWTFVSATALIQPESDGIDSGKWLDNRSGIVIRLVMGLVTLSVLAAFTGGPFRSPFGQYLLAALILLQVLAPTRPSVLKAFGLSIALVSVTQLITSSHPFWPEFQPPPFSVWDFACPALVIAAASTWITWSNLPGLMAERRDELGQSDPEEPTTPTQNLSAAR